MKNTILFLALLCAISCNTVKKFSSTTKASYDSSSIKGSDSTSLSTVHKSVNKLTSDDYEKTTVYDYDKRVNVIGHDTIIKYIPRIVTVYEKGHLVSSEASRTLAVDSTNIKKDDKTFVSAGQETETTTKESFRFPWPLAVIIMIILILIALVIYSRNWTKRW